MSERQRVSAFLVGAILSVAACGNGPSPAPTRLVLLTHDAFAVSEGVLEQFESAHRVDVQILKGSDAGAMVNQAILTKDAPLADVLYGIDNTFLSRATDAGIFDPYTSTALTKCLLRRTSSRRMWKNR